MPKPMPAPPCSCGHAMRPTSPTTPAEHSATHSSYPQTQPPPPWGIMRAPTANAAPPPCSCMHAMASKRGGPSSFVMPPNIPLIAHSGPTTPAMVDQAAPATNAGATDAGPVMRAMVTERRGAPREALVFHSDWPRPVHGPGQVLIKAAAASVNPGDWCAALFAPPTVDPDALCCP